MARPADDGSEAHLGGVVGTVHGKLRHRGDVMADGPKVLAFGDAPGLRTPVAHEVNDLCRGNEGVAGGQARGRVDAA